MKNFCFSILVVLCLVALFPQASQADVYENSFDAFGLSICIPKDAELSITGQYQLRLPYFRNRLAASANSKILVADAGPAADPLLKKVTVSFSKISIEAKLPFLCDTLDHLYFVTLTLTQNGSVYVIPLAPIRAEFPQHGKNVCFYPLLNQTLNKALNGLQIKLSETEEMRKFKLFNPVSGMYMQTKAWIVNGKEFGN